jgi:hypothetical protein
MLHNVLGKLILGIFPFIIPEPSESKLERYQRQASRPYLDDHLDKCVYIYGYSRKTDDHDEKIVFTTIEDGEEIPFYSTIFIDRFTNLNIDPYTNEFYFKYYDPNPMQRFVNANGKHVGWAEDSGANRRIYFKQMEVHYVDITPSLMQRAWEITPRITIPICNGSLTGFSDIIIKENR